MWHSGWVSQIRPVAWHIYDTLAPATAGDWKRLDDGRESLGGAGLLWTPGWRA